MPRAHNHKKRRLSHKIKIIVMLAFSAMLVGAGSFALWVATLDIPDVNSFADRRVTESTKIYDRTGTILLYDTGSNAKRTVIPLAEMSLFIPKASIAIEDGDFYTNIGIEPMSILRAVFANTLSGGFGQGGSTITQQVVKNSLLTTNKTLTRKIKEWVLAVKLTRVMSKEKILETYLNETSWGGTVFGVEEASQQFFGRPAKDVTLAQAAYLAAIPQAPTYYSPYGTHRVQLDARQKLVLSRMKSLEAITDEEYEAALAEKVDFLSKDAAGIRAPHFVMFIKEYLSEAYGEETVDSGGLRVITTLDYDMQQKAEGVITKFSKPLEENFGAKNIALVAIDPKSGDILTMVGSRDYFDKEIDGNFNVALAKRQPGSTFKPFVYATAFKKGYTPETVLWDVKTEFSTACNPDGTPRDPSADPKKVCYSPNEYDDIFEGPIQAKKALAQSRNIPAVEALYLAGIPSALETAEDMGINITSGEECGLTLVLGGCEVSLLDLVSAYGVFANDGVRNPYRSVLEVKDSAGNTLEKAVFANPTQELHPDIARQISSILSDTSLRMNSLKPIGESVGRSVAIKTGTTNDYRDVWTLGYTPSLVVGAWAGNNDNKPLKPNVAGLIISPLWGAYMSQVAKNFPPETFGPPPGPLTDGKPVLRGIWQGGSSYWKDRISGKLATEYTPTETREEVVFNSIHSILQWVNKSDPRGPAPSDPSQDSQYPYWEYSVAKWAATWRAAHPEFQETQNPVIPTATDDVHVPGNFPTISISSPVSGALVNPRELLPIQLQVSGKYPAQKADVYLNGKYVLTARNNPTSFSFVPSDVGDISANNTLSVTLYDSVFNSTQATTTFSVADTSI